MSRPTGYSKKQIWLHWAVVILVLLQFVFHEGIADASDLGVQTGTYSVTIPVIGHAVGGSVIFLLVLWRLILRRTRGAPAPPASEPMLFQRLSLAAHLAFYGLLILLPITGVAAWAGQSEAAGDVHEVLRAILFFLVLAHVGAVLVHQFVWKTDLMTRMTRAED